MVSFICWWAICFISRLQRFRLFYSSVIFFYEKSFTYHRLPSRNGFSSFQLIEASICMWELFFFTYFTEIEWRVGKWKPVKGWLFTFMEMRLVHFIYNGNLKLDMILRKQLCSIFFFGFPTRMKTRWSLN